MSIPRFEPLTPTLVVVGGQPLDHRGDRPCKCMFPAISMPWREESSGTRTSCLSPKQFLGRGLLNRSASEKKRGACVYGRTSRTPMHGVRHARSSVNSMNYRMQRGHAGRCYLVDSVDYIFFVLLYIFSSFLSASCRTCWLAFVPPFVCIAFALHVQLT